MSRVVAGDFGLAEHAVEADHAVVGGEGGALRRGEDLLVDELVEDRRGAPGGGDLAGVGEPFGEGAQRLGLGAVVFGLGDGGQVGELVFVVVGARQHGERVTPVDLVGGAGGRVVGDGEGDHVGGVAVPAAGQRDVEGAAAGVGGGDGVGGVHGAALRGVGGGGVAERDVFGDVVSRAG